MAVMRFNRTIAWRLALALALLIGQAGAQMHAYGHVAPDSRPLDPAGLHTQPCNQCLSFAPLLSAVGASSFAPHLDLGTEIRVVGPTSSAYPARHRIQGFQSRAPPVRS